MELEIIIDNEVALTLRPMRQRWPNGDSIVIHDSAARLSCGLNRKTERSRIVAWLAHLVPENGHYDEFRAKASKRMEKHGYGDAVTNVAQALWGNADTEFTGKVLVRAYDSSGRYVHTHEHDRYANIGNDEVGMLVAAAARSAEHRSIPPQTKAMLRTHGLSGNRGKISLRWDWRKHQWMLPGGSSLSSHILKEESSRVWLPAEAAIESYCQRVLKLAGIATATTRARLYSQVATVVSTRTDRIDHRDGTTLRRTHQEEWSQAIRIQPYQKNDDRPDTDWRSLFRLLHTHGQHPEQQHEALARAIAGLTLVGCADTHRRNIGIQHVEGEEGTKIVLAPLYDCSSIEGTQWTANKRAIIPIGGEAAFDQIRGEHWRRLATTASVDTALVLDAVREIAEKLPDALRDAACDCAEHDHAATPRARDTRIEAITRHTIERCKRTTHELGTLEATRQTRAPVKVRPRPPVAKPLPVRTDRQVSRKLAR